jgi:regulator of protease activity HflC (stomatin/prohibitin superfamily)
MLSGQDGAGSSSIGRRPEFRCRAPAMMPRRSPLRRCSFPPHQRPLLEGRLGRPYLSPWAGSKLLGITRRERRRIMIAQVGSILVVVAAVAFLASSIWIFREYERGVVFFLGRFQKVTGPGLVFIIPLIQQLVRVDLRTVVLEVPTQDVISRDNVSVKVSAVIYFRIIDAKNAIIEVENYFNATSQLAQTTLRSVLGKHQLDDMLAEREKLNIDVQQALDAQTGSWGIKVSNVEIKQIDLTESMIRAIARQAEAERERRAKVIHAEGELQAAEKLFQAATILAKEPQSIQLRYLETLTVIGADKNTTVIFPLPIDLISQFLAKDKRD